MFRGRVPQSQSPPAADAFYPPMPHRAQAAFRIDHHQRLTGASASGTVGATATCSGPLPGTYTVAVTAANAYGGPVTAWRSRSSANRWMGWRPPI